MAFTIEVPDEAAIKSEVLEQVKPVPKEVDSFRRQLNAMLLRL
jgi:hypothetical protein